MPLVVSVGRRSHNSPFRLSLLVDEKPLIVTMEFLAVGIVEYFSFE